MISTKILPCILFGLLSLMLACSKQSTSIEEQQSVSDREAFQMLREAVLKGVPLKASESNSKPAHDCSSQSDTCAADDLLLVNGSKLRELLSMNWLVMQVPPARMATTYNFNFCRSQLIVIHAEGFVRSSRIGISDAGVCEFGPDLGTVCYAFFKSAQTGGLKLRAIRGTSASPLVDVEKLIPLEKMPSCTQ